ncbi:MAG: purine-binding chemotaxis protein CheW [Verrucomicrobia bacterium]|nr:purine-binding chemotaxis protein CheW [Verrucomicrobiota bacterium]
MAIVETHVPASWKQTEQHLVFRLAGEEYGFSVLKIEEIVQWVELTRVPRVPSFILGVMNLRGKVVPVIDLHLRFGLPPSPVTERTCVIVLQVQRETGPLVIGVVADDVMEVVDVPAEQIKPPPEFGARVSTEFIAGIVQAEGRSILLLDAERVLDNRDWMFVEKVLEEKEQAHE